MNTDSDLGKATAVARTGEPAAAAGALRSTSTGAGQQRPRVKISEQGYFIDHPDSKLGERLMASALGVTNSDAMDGILRQLVRASVRGSEPDEINLAFMIEMVNGIQPRDPIEAMLVAQMVSVHVMAMRCAQHFACAADIVQQDSSARALSRLARTFTAQVEGLNRHRSSGEPAIRVQNVSVQDGGNAIVGNVTQHADVTVKERDAPQHDPTNAVWSAQA